MYDFERETLDWLREGKVPEPEKHRKPTYKGKSELREYLYLHNSRLPRQEENVTYERLVTDYHWQGYMARVFISLYGTRMSSVAAGKHQHGTIKVLTRKAFTDVLNARPEWKEVHVNAGNEISSPPAAGQD